MLNELLLAKSAFGRFGTDPERFAEFVCDAQTAWHRLGRLFRGGGGTH